MVAPVSAAVEFRRLTKEMFQKKKKDQLRCLMDESFFFFLEQDVEDFFLFVTARANATRNSGEKLLYVGAFQGCD